MSSSRDQTVSDSDNALLISISDDESSESSDEGVSYIRGLMAQVSGRSATLFTPTHKNKPSNIVFTQIGHHTAKSTLLNKGTRLPYTFLIRESDTHGMLAVEYLNAHQELKQARLQYQVNADGPYVKMHWVEVNNSKLTIMNRRFRKHTAIQKFAYNMTDPDDPAVRSLFTFLQTKKGLLTNNLITPEPSTTTLALKR